jgi:SLT domain-containing protein
LLKSLKDIENKEKDFNNYENGITFLDRQLKKSLAKVEQKNIEITKLVQ